GDAHGKLAFEGERRTGDSGIHLESPKTKGWIACSRPTPLRTRFRILMIGMILFNPVIKKTGANPTTAITR
ncbi:MAG TPA: hypothetical protein VG672_00275, partial [Bryobacteraceae bacterium]|nr:hypothetical protein [Bryobacteraceae bacterium]